MSDTASSSETDQGTMIRLQTPSFYSNNRNNYFFCCFVDSICWLPKKQEIRLYVDVRGELDLIPPSFGDVVMCEKRMFRGRWVSEMPQNTPFGRYKGYYSFPEEAFAASGTYYFCYFSATNISAHYQSIPILTVSPEGLLKTFVKHNAVATDGRSPFADDTPKSDRLRWEGVVPKEVLERHLSNSSLWNSLISLVYRSKWWVE